MYRTLMTISLLLVAGSSAYMSVYGLMSVFMNHAIVIICMGLGMEIGKILTVSYLYWRWQALNGFFRTLYILIVSVLVFLTSIEIMGFLSQSHISGSHEILATETTLLSLKNESALLKQQMSVVDETLAGLPVSHVSRRIKERKATGYDKKQARLLEISKKQAELENKLLKDREKAGPIFSTARIMKINEMDAVALFILLLILILEPLSIGLTLAVSSAWLTPKAISEKKQHRSLPTNRNGPTEELKSLCDKFNLTISQVADITGRKKQKTCERWLDGTTHVPERALRAVHTWVRRQNLETPFDRKILTMPRKG